MDRHAACLLPVGRLISGEPETEGVFSLGGHGLCGLEVGKSSNLGFSQVQVGEKWSADKHAIHKVGTSLAWIEGWKGNAN